MIEPYIMEYQQLIMLNSGVITSYTNRKTLTSKLHFYFLSKTVSNYSIIDYKGSKLDSKTQISITKFVVCFGSWYKHTVCYFSHMQYGGNKFSRLIFGSMLPLGAHLRSFQLIWMYCCICGLWT